MTELERLRAEYVRRDADPSVRARNAAEDAGTSYLLRTRARAAREVLDEVDLPLAGMRVLDIGCGRGDSLDWLADSGATRYGVDLAPWRLGECRGRDASLHLACSDAGHLPFADASFDLCLLFTVLSSVLDPGLVHAIAAEAARVLVPGGTLLVYDLRVRTGNPATRSVSPAELDTLFPDWTRSERRVSLALPVARALAPHSSRLCRLLETLPCSKTHLLAALQKPC